MSRNITALLLSLLLIVSFSTNVSAKNHVKSMDIQAVIETDGSMNITQTWEGIFEDGTENYIPIHAAEYLTISELRVNDAKRTYKEIADWNIDASLEEKAGKCGVNYTEDGYEICFGISEYGSNRYTISYKLDQVIGGYTDMDGVNFRFVNDGMNTVPTDVDISIRFADGTPITDEIADIWAFGFEGEVVFQDGTIHAFTKEPLQSDNHMTVMFGVDKGILSPARQETSKFDEVKNAAFENSDYASDTSEEFTFFDGIVTVCYVGFPLILIYILFDDSKIKRKGKVKKLFKRFGYYRELPNRGDVYATYVLGHQFDLCDESAILTHGMLELIETGCLEALNQSTTGVMGNGKELVCLKLSGNGHRNMSEADESLFCILEGAAGADGVLQEKELKKFAAKNDELLRNYIKMCEDEGKKYLKSKQCIKNFDKPVNASNMTLTGEEELGQVIGFKKYLEDFSLIAERGLKELPIWKELLSYGMLFGIADKVAKQMKELYPENIAQIDGYYNRVNTINTYHSLLYRTMRKTESRRSGSGGSASSDGGGGYSGGGSGGGSR